jgi:predicted transcriptional regulator
MYIITLSDEEEASTLGISLQTLKKYHKELVEKGYLTITQEGDKVIKIFNLEQCNTEKSQ